MDLECDLQLVFFAYTSRGYVHVCMPQEVFHREATDLNDIWFATVLTVIATIRAHQADSLVMSNGLFALGRLSQAAVGLKNLVCFNGLVREMSHSNAWHDSAYVLSVSPSLSLYFSRIYFQKSAVCEWASVRHV